MIENKNKVLRIHPKDNCLVALNDINSGEVIPFEGEFYTLLAAVKSKHKFVTDHIAAGGIIYQYGVPVAKALHPLKRGEVITTSKVVHYANENFSYQPNKDFFRTWSGPDISTLHSTTFQGYKRADGRVGVRNNWIIVPLVFCQNNNLMTLRNIFMKALGYEKTTTYHMYLQKLISLHQAGENVADHLAQADDVWMQATTDDERLKIFPFVDGVKFLFHSSGCGETNQDSLILCKLLAAYINHPNVYGATVLSLGCQKAEIKLLQQELNALNPNFNKPLYLLEQQALKTEDNLIKQAIKKTFLGLEMANQCRREEVSATHLVAGTECGASDGFSGITANPVIGECTDLLVKLGGSSILSEFPELVGVEAEIVNRCTTRDAAQKFIDLMKAYSQNARAVGSDLSNNPSPGNIKDGLITNAIKSAGAAKKGGTAPIVDVLDYANVISKQGLNLVCTPGNDVESTTGLVGAGAKIVLFSTGLGTPTGNPISPIIKIATNSNVFHKMNDIIDFNVGDIISDNKTIQQKSIELFYLLLEVASGKLTKAEILQQDDFIPWRRGISL